VNVHSYSGGVGSHVDLELFEFAKV